MRILSNKIDGKHIISVFSRSSGYPGMKLMNAAASKYRYDPASFRLAVRDWWEGEWEKSPYRSDSCSLEGYKLTRKGVLEFRRHEKKAANQPRKAVNVQSVRAPRACIARRGGFSLADLMMDQSCLCASCGCDLIASSDYELDHIQPVSKGGCNEYWNLQFLCSACNRSKSDKDPFQWAATTGTNLPEKFLSRFT